MNGGDKGRVNMASNLRFSSFRRRFSPPLLIVYSRQKPVHDDDGEEEHEDTLQNVDTLAVSYTHLTLPTILRV